MSDVTTASAADAPRSTKAIPIPVDAVTVDTAGFVTRSLVVRLPQGVGLQDVVDPTIWRTVQGSAASMRKLDRVTLVSFGEDWIADCVVSAASNEALTLSKPVKIDLGSRASVVLPEDDDYRVIWTGKGYNVTRKADGRLMRPDPFPTVASATRFLDAQRPRQVA